MSEMSQAHAAEEAIRAEMRRRPPVIGVVGVSGTGKSSTVNAMFRTDLPISHTTACTKDFWNVELAVHTSQGQRLLRVVDAPGLGEDIRADARTWTCTGKTCRPAT